MDTMVKYEVPKLESFRSFSHDAVEIYGFMMKDTLTGAVKAKFTVKDGLR